MNELLLEGQKVWFWTDAHTDPKRVTVVAALPWGADIGVEGVIPHKSRVEGPPIGGYWTFSESGIDRPPISLGGQE